MVQHTRSTVIDGVLDKSLANRY